MSLHQPAGVLDISDAFVVIDLTAGLALGRSTAEAVGLDVSLGVIGHGSSRSILASRRRFPSSVFMHANEFTLEFARSILDRRQRVLMIYNPETSDTKLLDSERTVLNNFVLYMKNALKAHLYLVTIANEDNHHATADMNSRSFVKVDSSLWSPASFTSTYTTSFDIDIDVNDIADFATKRKRNECLLPGWTTCIGSDENLPSVINADNIKRKLWPSEI